MRTEFIRAGQRPAHISWQVRTMGVSDQNIDRNVETMAEEEVVS